jgi:hypothetical protein
MCMREVGTGVRMNVTLSEAKGTVSGMVPLAALGVTTAAEPPLSRIG